MNAQTAQDETGLSFTFTKTEFKRLAAYRAAVRAGFYTDEYPEMAHETAEAPCVGISQIAL